MNDAEIYAQLTDVFRDVFDDDSISLNSGTTAQDIPGWDSQAHISLVLAAEMSFGIRFRTSELDSMHNVGDFVSAIAAKKG